MKVILIREYITPILIDLNQLILDNKIQYNKLNELN